MAGEKINPRRVIEYQGSFYVEADACGCDGCCFNGVDDELNECCNQPMESNEFLGCSDRKVIYIEVKS